MRPPAPAPVTAPTKTDSSRAPAPAPATGPTSSSHGSSEQAKKSKGKRGPPKSTNPSATTVENHLPHARVQKIIKADFDIGPCSKESVYLISAATEYFVQKLSDAAYAQARMNKNSTVQYTDLANAVKENYDFQWLQDVVPSAEPLSVALAKRQEKLDERGSGISILPTFDLSGQLNASTSSTSPAKSGGGKSSAPAPVTAPTYSSNDQQQESESNSTNNE